MLGCRLLGHRYRFRAEGATMRWDCLRGCGAGGAKEYGSAGAATRYADALNRDGRNGIGRRAPLLGMLPLRVWRALADRARHRD